VVTIPGTGTDRLFDTKFKCPLMGTKNLKEAVNVALGEAKTGDIILFSPAFSSFAQFNNEYERGDLFMKIIKKLK
jgi:UDP-N-acetylmuramoylalanine--D-glutamate ligase